MDTVHHDMQIESRKTRGGKAVLLSLPMALLTLVLILGANASTDPLKLIPAIISWFFVNILFFLMISTGRTDRYRAILFITLAVCLPPSFILELYELRGHFMVLTPEDVLQGQTPFCHIVIPQTLLPAIFNREIIFASSLSGFAYSIGNMVVIWLGITLVLGRGWCSWACMYGGWDDGWSRLRKRVAIKMIDRKWTYVPFALLLAIVLLSAVTYFPEYCNWLCPFKAVTEFEAVTSLKVMIQTFIFVALFLGLVIVLPILTKRRMQCSCFCPFGAMQSFTNTISPFDIRIDTEKCVKCQRCIRACPVFSLREESLRTGRPAMTCVKCGKCVDVCPNGAITYHIKGTAVNIRSNVARMLFLYPAFIVLVLMSAGFLSDIMYRIGLLFTTGSMIQ
jgi:ferredoxin